MSEVDSLEVDSLDRAGVKWGSIVVAIRDMDIPPIDKGTLLLVIDEGATEKYDWQLITVLSPRGNARVVKGLVVPLKS
jgi:hypothetical protein